MGLLARSLLVLALLFGLLFAVGTGVLYYYHFPISWAIAWAVLMIGLQYAFGPRIIDWIYKINWQKPEELAPEFAEFLSNLCAKRKIPVPRFGVIEDGNPNAFTYGHVPGDARLVVTRGLLQMLNKEEYEAVVAHEIGHIHHYDFIVMTIASLVPALLYMLYVWTRGRRNNGGAAVAVAIGAYAAYFVSQYIVLFLSRVREYFADEHAANSVDDANAISSALVKIAYGLARIPQQQEGNEDSKEEKKQPAYSQSQLLGSLGICNFSSAAPMALYSTTASGQFSADQMVKAMQWDLWNPWARFFEIQSTHPLIARRIRAASKIAASKNQPEVFSFNSGSGEMVWHAFATDLLFLTLPYLGLGLSLLCGFMSVARGVHSSPSNGILALFMLKYVLLFTGAGWMGRLAYSFGSNFKPSRIVDLVAEVEVSHINAIPVELSGEIIGRGVPGVFWSKDLVLQDESGFITLIYRQPLGILETLFGVFRAGHMVGKKGVVRGWYRRGPSPYLELRDANFEDGQKMHCYQKGFLWFCAITTTFIGLLMALPR